MSPCSLSLSRLKGQEFERLLSLRYDVLSAKGDSLTLAEKSQTGPDPWPPRDSRSGSRRTRVPVFLIRSALAGGRADTCHSHGRLGLLGPRQSSDGDEEEETKKEDSSAHLCEGITFGFRG